MTPHDLRIRKMLYSQWKIDILEGLLEAAQALLEAAPATLATTWRKKLSNSLSGDM